MKFTKNGITYEVNDVMVDAFRNSDGWVEVAESEPKKVDEKKVVTEKQTKKK